MSLEASPHMQAVWRVACASILSIVPAAMLLPMVAVELSTRGYADWLVGVFAASLYLGLLSLTPFAPRIRERLGASRAHKLGMAVSTLAILVFFLGDGFVAWSIANSLVGLSAALLWGTAEGLIAEHAPKDKLGRITGVYQTAMGAAFALGPALAFVFSLNLQSALTVALILELVSWLPIVTLRFGARARKEANGAAPWLAVARRAPTLIAVACLGGLFESGLNAMGAVHALGLGIKPSAAAFAAGVIAIGSLLVQYPAGWLADRISASGMLCWSIGGLAVSSFAAALTPFATWLVWPIAMVWGALGGILYTLAMIQVGHIFAAGLVARATALVITSYTLGALCGPALVGAAMDASPQFGLAALLSVACGLALLSMRFSRFLQLRAQEGETS